MRNTTKTLAEEKMLNVWGFEKLKDQKTPAK
jgi:hypothetical protein